MSFLNLVFRAFRQQVRLEGGVEVLVLAGALTVTNRTAQLLNLDPNGGPTRNVDLPAEEDSSGLWYAIHNVSVVAGEDLIVRNDAGATVITIEPGESALIACTGTVWAVINQTTTQEVGQLQADVAALQAAAPVTVVRQITTADLALAALSQTFLFSVPVGDIPARSLIIARGLQLNTEFSGGGSAVVTADLGDAVDPDGWFDVEDIFTGAGTGPKVIPTTTGAFLQDEAADMTAAVRVPQVVITSDVNVDTLTAGDLEAWVTYIEVPLGSAIPG